MNEKKEKIDHFRIHEQICEKIKPHLSDCKEKCGADHSGVFCELIEVICQFADITKLFDSGDTILKAKCPECGNNNAILNITIIGNEIICSQCNKRF